MLSLRWLTGKSIQEHERPVELDDFVSEACARIREKAHNPLKQSLSQATDEALDRLKKWLGDHYDPKIHRHYQGFMLDTRMYNDLKTMVLTEICLRDPVIRLSPKTEAQFALEVPEGDDDENEMLPIDRSHDEVITQSAYRNECRDGIDLLIFSILKDLSPASREQLAWILKHRYEETDEKAFRKDYLDKCKGSVNVLKVEENSWACMRFFTGLHLQRKVSKIAGLLALRHKLDKSLSAVSVLVDEVINAKEGLAEHPKYPGLEDGILSHRVRDFLYKLKHQSEFYSQPLYAPTHIQVTLPEKTSACQPCPSGSLNCMKRVRAI